MNLDPFKISYGREKFTTTVLYMATSTQPLPERLAIAYAGLVTISRENVTPEAWLEMEKMRDALTSVEALTSEGDIRRALPR